MSDDTGAEDGPYRLFMNPVGKPVKAVPKATKKTKSTSDKRAKRHQG